MEAYLQRIVKALERLQASPPVQVTVSAEEVILDPRRATLVGLIVNELVTNALQHAFPAGAAGEIQVRLGRAGADYRLEIVDTGIGMASPMPTQPTSLGLHLVQLYAQRLHGRIHVHVDGGTRFTITFPAEAAE
jgi:two-component sensor histidine kinase